METTLTSAQETSSQWRSLIGKRRAVAVLAAWLFTCSVAVPAADSKPEEPAQAPGAQQNKTTTQDKKTTIANEADSASCKIKSNESAIRINTGEDALQVESDTQEGITGANNTSSSEDNLTLRAPSREESGLDQTHLSSDIAVKGQSRKYKSDSRTATDLKCTAKEAGDKNPTPASN